MTLTIIVPTFNEARTVETLLQKVLAIKFPIAYELIIVDDHSSDPTYTIERRIGEMADGIRVTTLRNHTNQGKGSCIRQGLRHATGDMVIVQDGDLEYDPREIPVLLRPILEGRVTVVFGSRFVSRRWPIGMAWPNYVANRVLTRLANCLYGLSLTDLMGCYKIMPRELLQGLDLQARRFEFDLEVAAKLGKRRIPITELPITYSARTWREGKKIGARDFVMAIWTLLRYR